MWESDQYCDPLEEETEPRVNVCKNCEWFKRMPESCSDQCRRHAPEGNFNEGGAEWPKVDPDDFCGDFAQRWSCQKKEK